MGRRRKEVRTLVVVSATYHYRHDGRLWAYAPYARELSVWADLVPDLLVIAPEVDTAPPADTAPILQDNVRLHGLPPTGGETLLAKARQVLALPRLLALAARSLRYADAVHVRAPGNTAVLGLLLGPLFSRRLVAKYAGQWVGYPEEPWSVRLQRAVLRSWWWRGPVTVYGDWPDQPDKVMPFFTSVLDREQVREAAEVALARTSHPGLHLLFVGRLTAPKNADALIEAAARTAEAGEDIRVTIVGEGPERGALEAAASRRGIADRVCFEGALPFDEVLKRYAAADVLALVSESEGWPKAIAEAMAFGLVCIGSDRGLVPWMLEDGRGIVVGPGDADALADALIQLARDPDARLEMARRSAAWAGAYSLDELGDAVRALLEDRWQVTLRGQDQRIRVLHVTDTLEAGGAERVAVNLVNELPRNRFVTALGTTRAEGPLAAEVAPDVVRLSLARRQHRISDVFATRRLARFLDAQKIDVVHAHGTSLFIVFAATVLRPTAVVWHDHLGAAPEVRAEHLFVYRLAARRADVVVTVNWALARSAVDVLGVPAERVHRLANFVLEPRAGTGERAAGLPGTRQTRIVCVANLRAHKDHQTLLSAMAQVRRQHPNAHLLLAGGAPDPQLLAGLHESLDRLDLRSSVSLLGSRPDVGALLAGCRIGVLSSSSEGFPLALLEYATAGLAVVATDVGDCAEVLDGGRLGLLVPPSDPDALADALSSLLSDPDRVARLGASLQASVPERYSSDRMVAAVADLYSVALGRPVHS